MREIFEAEDGDGGPNVEAAGRAARAIENGSEGRDDGEDEDRGGGPAEARTQAGDAAAELAGVDGGAIEVAAEVVGERGDGGVAILGLFFEGGEANGVEVAGELAAEVVDGGGARDSDGVGSGSPGARRVIETEGGWGRRGRRPG